MQDISRKGVFGSCTVDKACNAYYLHILKGRTAMERKDESKRGVQAKPTLIGSELELQHIHCLRPPSHTSRELSQPTGEPSVINACWVLMLLVEGASIKEPVIGKCIHLS